MSSVGTHQTYAAAAEGLTPDRPEFQPDVDLSLSGAVTGRDVFIHFFVRWWVVGFASWLVLTPVNIVITLLMPDEEAVTVPLLLLMGSIPFFIAWASLFIPVRTGNSQYGQLLDDGWEAAESAYGNVYEAINRRRVPEIQITPRRVASDVGGAPKNYMLIKRGKVEIWVVVLASGVDLWVAWTAWVRQIPAFMPFSLMKQQFNLTFLKGSDLHEAMRLNEVRATQWAIHAAVIDGVDATVAGNHTTVARSFGHDLPVESSERASVPTPSYQNAPIDITQPESI